MGERCKCHREMREGPHEVLVWRNPDCPIHSWPSGRERTHPTPPSKEEAIEHQRHSWMEAENPDLEENE